jgi:DNA cross-link repair 1A protein
MNRDLHCHKVPGTSFLVDGFRHARDSACQHFFLSHFHSDHYTGLDERFDRGQIFCTPVTAKLVIARLGVPPHRIKARGLEEPFVVDGVTVTFIDANHCPGAALLLFELPSTGRTILHCGDMRWNHPVMCKGAVLQRVQGKVDTVFLDTTYAEEKHRFPPQEESIATVVQEVVSRLPSPPPVPRAGGQDNGCLVLLGAYTIGKEKLLLEVSRATGRLIYVTPEKMGERG